MERKQIITLGAAALVGAGLGLVLRHRGNAEPDPVTLKAPEWSVAQGIDEAAGYLVNVDDDKGRFKYLVNGEGQAIVPTRYNSVRHAGAIYALADVEMQSANADVRAKAGAAAERSAGYLVTKYVRPIKDHADTLAVFADPKEEGGHERRFNAKLGGTGLGLIGLMGRYRAIDGGVNAASDLTTAQGLARFLVFMQKDNGDFTSNYTDEKGKSSDFESLYYPGETILGLTMLYEVDKDPKWLETAAKGVARLVEIRKGQTKLPADHWLMIAMDRLYPVFGDLKAPPLTREAMVDHAIALANAIIDGQDHVMKPAIDGCFTRDGPHDSHCDAPRGIARARASPRLGPESGPGPRARPRGDREGDRVSAAHPGHDRADARRAPGRGADPGGGRRRQQRGRRRERAGRPPARGPHRLRAARDVRDDALPADVRRRREGVSTMTLGEK